MTPTAPDGFDVFLSYSSHDENSVLPLEDALERCGLRVWRDRHKIVPGDAYIQRIEAGLQLSQNVVVINSREALISTWVQREWNVSLTLEKRIIPVRIDDSEVPLMLRALEFIDFRDVSRLEQAAQEIAAGVHSLPASSTARQAPQKASNPSVLGLDVVVIERMIASGASAARRLEIARWVAAIGGLTISSGVIVFGSATVLSWVAVASAGSLITTGAGVWLITAQLALNHSQVTRLNGIKTGIELYCPNQRACAEFRV